MLARIQDLEPAGVGARDLRECLLLQLRQAPQEQSIPLRLVQDCFDELINHRWSEISKRFGISQVDVQRAADEIAKLDPKPGLVYSNARDNYITPDLVVDKIDGQYHVFLNDTHLPRLKLSRAYQEIARDKKKFEGENKDFISNKLNSANWMIQAIEQRRQTMLKVMHFIVDRQRDFFEKGSPLAQAAHPARGGRGHQHARVDGEPRDEREVRPDAARRPARSSSSSPRGCRPRAGGRLGPRHQGADSEAPGQDEDPKRPLTDQAIVNILKEGGVQIARRTVAKYRDQLGVLSARMRKRV